MLGTWANFPEVGNFLYCTSAKNYENWLTVDRVAAMITRLFYFLAHLVVRNRPNNYVSDGCIM